MTVARTDPFTGLLRFAGWLLSLLVWFHSELNAAPPNVLLILTDDHGYGDVSAYGATDVKTPHIDRMAAEGMQFMAMRANCTVCSPTRAALLTGRYADRVGVPGVIRTEPADSWGYLDPTVPTLANHLQQSGYRTALIGKWHLGLESPNTPNERGFDFFHGFLGDMMDNYLTHRRHGQNYLRRNGETIDPVGHATELFSDWAIDYLQERATEPNLPFFLYLAYNAPHFPIEPPEDWVRRIQQRMPELDEVRARNVAFVEHLDHHLGRVLLALDRLGLAQDTIVIFTADNGGSLAHGQSNRPWRGGKQSHYDGGLRVPFLVRWPDHVQPASRCDYAGLVFDLFPTLLEVTGRELPSDLDSVSLLPALRGDSMPTSRELYFVRREGGATYGGKTYEALIRGDWKLLQNDPYSPLELYHLTDDPLEQQNVAARHPMIVKQMSEGLRGHIQRAGSARWQRP